MACHLRVLTWIATSVFFALATLAALLVGATPRLLTQFAIDMIGRNILTRVSSAKLRAAALGVRAAIVACTVRIIWWQMQPLR